MKHEVGASAPLLSIDDIDGVKLGESPFEFPYVLDDGRHTGIFISVYGSQSRIVQDAINEANNERRREDAMREAAGLPPEQNIRTKEEDDAFAARLAAVRIAGWRGLSDEVTPANKLRIVTVNADIRAKVVIEANKLANFIKVSPKA